MSDFSRRYDDAVNVKALLQIYALRGWLTAFLTQTLNAEATIKYRLAGLEQEALWLRARLDQTTPAIESLRESIRSVDDAIRRRRDEIHAAVAAQSDQAETERDTPVEGSEHGRRSGRRKKGQSGAPTRK